MGETESEREMAPPAPAIGSPTQAGDADIADKLETKPHIAGMMQEAELDQIFKGPADTTIQADEPQEYTDPLAAQHAANNEGDFFLPGFGDDPTTYGADKGKAPEAGSAGQTGAAPCPQPRRNSSSSSSYWMAPWPPARRPASSFARRGEGGQHGPDVATSALRRRRRAPSSRSASSTRRPFAATVAPMPGCLGRRSREPGGSIEAIQALLVRLPPMTTA